MSIKQCGLKARNRQNRVVLWSQVQHNLERISRHRIYSALSRHLLRQDFCTGPYVTLNKDNGHMFFKNKFVMEFTELVITFSKLNQSIFVYLM